MRYLSLVSVFDTCLWFQCPKKNDDVGAASRTSSVGNNPQCNSQNGEDEEDEEVVTESQSLIQ